MIQYTAYVRSGAAVVASGFVYVIVGFIALGLLLDVFPQHEDMLVAAWLFVALPLTYFLSMLTSKSKLSVTVIEEKIVLNMVRGSAAALQMHTIPLNIIKGINMRNSIAAGSYILLELEYGLRIKLYSKQFVFNTNNTFYDLFLALKKVTENKPKVPSVSKSEYTPDAEQVVAPMPVYENIRPAVEQPAIRIVIGKENVVNAVKQQQGMYTTHFKGSQFASVVGIGIWLVFLVMSVIPVMVNASSIVITNLPVLLLVVWVLPMSLLLNYLVLSDEYLEVKKHNLPWFKKRIYLKEIKEIGFEQSSFTNTITILYKDYRYENYHCPTLKTTQWTDLKNALEARGVQVKKG
jgi:hypothetical protein